jgi:hypothetical protein
VSDDELVERLRVLRDELKQASRLQADLAKERWRREQLEADLHHTEAKLETLEEVWGERDHLEGELALERQGTAYLEAMVEDTTRELTAVRAMLDQLQTERNLERTHRAEPTTTRDLAEEVRLLTSERDRLRDDVRFLLSLGEKTEAQLTEERRQLDITRALVSRLLAESRTGRSGELPSARDGALVETSE